MTVLPFLKQIAQHVQSKYDDRIDEVTLVFPNQRAGLFFRKYLAEELSVPIWSPAILSMEDFVRQYCRLQATDKFTLIVELYQVYRKHISGAESFERFYYWGEMLLGDFEDIDKYLIDAKYLFTDLSNQKALDDYFDYLTHEQKKIIVEFWSTFSDQSSEEKKNFQMIWGKLYDIYSEFTTTLKNKNSAYTGLVYKEVANNLPKINKNQPIIFAGFNALTTSEERIITHFIEEGAEIKWDVDAYYMYDERQEAGSFLREYKKKKVFAKSLEEPYPTNIEDKNSTPIYLNAVAQKTGQVKLLGTIISEIQKQENFNPEKTVIVLPDENLLFPVLNSLPESIKKINVTMGFPLVNTPIYSLVELLLELQQQSKEQSKGRCTFYYKNTLRVFKHPLIQQYIPQQALANIKNIESHNWIRINVDQLQADELIIPTVFQKVENTSDIIVYLQKVIGLVTVTDEVSLIEKEYAYQFYTQLNRIKEVVEQFRLDLDLAAFIRLFSQMMQSLRLPFTGEPLNGLQIMGVLETRNLDFENVFILSMNEGSFPSAGKGHSFVPYNIRKGYGLPTFDQQDAIYAYLFYRLLHKAEIVHLFYTTEGGVTGGGELSRFVQQLKYESKRPVELTTLSHTIAIKTQKPIVIEKSESVFEALKKYQVSPDDASQKRLTPSALNLYLDCRLRFYFRYVAEIYEYNELQDQIDPMVFGNLLHHAMENLYTQKRNVVIEKEDFKELKLLIDDAVKEAFATHYTEDIHNMELEGKRILAFEVIKKYVAQVLKRDSDYAPFEIVGLESKDYTINVDVEWGEGTILIGLKGIIDRIDLKGERIRVIDYKTGKDNRKVESVQSLFDRDASKRNKAAMQTILYSLLYVRNNQAFKGAVLPGVFNTKEAFSKKFDYHLEIEKEQVVNVKPILAEFEGYLKDLLSEMYSPFVPFDQTDDEKKCENCPYKGICAR